MKRTTIFIEEPVERDLKALAERQGRPAAALVREAIGEYLARRRDAGGRLSFLAAGRSGRSDVAERHEELLWEGEDPTAGSDAESEAPATKRRRSRGPRR